MKKYITTVHILKVQKNVKKLSPADNGFNVNFYKDEIKIKVEELQDATVSEYKNIRIKLLDYFSLAGDEY